MDEEGLRIRWSAPAGPRRRGAALRGAALLVLVSVLAAVTAGRAALDEEAPPPAARADCPTCAGSGKARCGTCGGRGEIWKPCPICDASGRKPCPVCATEEKRASSPAPGRLTCTLCGGRGVRASGRTCSRCLGEQSVSCTTCIGKGTLRCRKQVFDSVCPTCRFVGKVDCPACKGGSPAVEAAAPGRPQRFEPVAPSNGRATAGDIEARYARLSSTHDGHLDIFGDDPRPRLEPLRGEASRALKTLRAEGAAGAPSAEAIESFLSRLSSFRRRWGEIRELFLDEYRSFRTAKGVWASRERLVGGAAGARRGVAEKQWADRMDLALTIAEQRAAALEAVEPAWLPKEAADLTAIWTDLCVSAQSDIALASAAGKKGREEAVAAGATEEPGIEDEDREEAVPGEDLFAPIATAAVPAEEAWEVEPAPGGEDPPPAPETAVAPPSRREPDRRESGPAEEESEADPDRKSSAAPRSWAPVIWSAAGFAAATLLFGLAGRRRRSRDRA